MKRVLFTLVVMIASLLSLAQTIGEAMYVFRSDGQINGFLPGEIISIEYSDTDADGNKYDEIVTQIINTADTAYIIPLSVIDSVSFVTPEPVYKSDVINISEKLMPYVVSSENLTIALSDATPSDVMPRVGDKLVTLEMNDKFPAGFIGEVISVSPAQIECKTVDFEQVFETYYRVSSLYGYSDENYSRSSFTRGNDDIYGEFNLGTIKISNEIDPILQKLENSDSFALSGDVKFELSVTPTVHIISTLIVNKEYGTLFNVSLTGRLDMEETVGLYGELNWEHEFYKKYHQVPTGAPGVFAFFEIGLKLEASAKYTAGLTCNQSYFWGASYDYNSKNRIVKAPEAGGRFAPSSCDVKGTLEGELFVGPYIETGITLGHSFLDKIALNFKTGFKVEGNATPYKSEVREAEKNTKLYERMKDASLSLKLVAESKFEAKVAIWEVEHELPFKAEIPLLETNLVPTFSDTKLTQDDKGLYQASANYEELNSMADIGLALINIENNDDITIFYPEKNSDNGAGVLKQTFTNDASEEYKLYPIVNFLGIEMLANPFDSLVVQLCPDNNHPHMIDLGLPSGTKWSCCNVGASRPSISGSLFAWGETRSKSQYNWDTYVFSIYNSDGEFTWTCMSLGNDISGTSYDAARAVMGSPWRMPTAVQLNEIATKAKYKWITVDGVPGARYRGPSGKAIFLPAWGTGMWNDENLTVGECGDYWSSTQTPESYISYYISANPVGSSVCNYLYRGHGLAVRAVVR